MRLVTTITLILCSIWSIGQHTIDDVADYFRNYPEEKIFVHLSRTDFLAGETIYFKVFIRSGSLLDEERLSNVVYGEVLDASGNAIDQVRISLDIDGGNGSITIPATANSGIYTFRAYSLWMRNFSSETFYCENLRVVNAFKQLPARAESRTPTVRFFPEGGKLLQGIPSRVGVEYFDSEGKASALSAVLESSDGLAIKEVSTSKMGIGSFEFVPEPGVSYRLRSDSLGVIATLPKAAADGYGIKADRSGQNYDISLFSSDPVITIAMITRGKILTSQEVNINDGKGRIQLPVENLQSGINQLTVFNSKGMPVADRLFFKKPNDSFKIHLSASEENYGRREKIELSIETKDTAGNEYPPELSVSVYQYDSRFDENDQDIHAELWLTSDLKGIISNPGYYLNEATFREMDDLLLVRGWSRYNWNEMVSKSNAPHKYLPEFRLPVATGQVTMESQPVEDAIVYLSKADSIASTLVGRTGSDGNFIVEIPVEMSSSSLYIETSVEGAVVELFSPFEPGLPERMTTPLIVPEELGDFLVSLSEQIQVSNVFEPESPVQDLAPESFYGKGDNTYFLDDYTRFPVMEEVIREYVYGVYPRKQGGEFSYRVLDFPRNIVMTQAPLVLVDGVPIFNIDKLMELDPLLFQKIEVVKRRYGYGALLANGIVSFYTYKNDLGGYDLPSSTLQVNYESVQVNKQFYSPVYESKDSRVPDFRNQLYWNGRVQVEQGGTAQIEFFSSDIPGTYRVMVHGLASDGSADTAELFFKVR